MRILFILFVFLGITIALIIRYGLRKHRRFPWFEFYSRGRREGFTFKDIRFLKNITLQANLERPQSIFWSTRQLNRCLRPAIQKINADEEMAQERKALMIGKLLELRKKAEFNLPKYKRRIRDTRVLLPRQRLVVREKSYGTFVSWIIEANRKYLVVSLPSGRPGWMELRWVGKRIHVYFWRRDDAGYVFESKVMEQIFHEEYPLLYVNHSNNLIRSQLRKSIRIDTDIRVEFYPLVYSTVDGIKKAFIPKTPRIGKIVDLSDSGCCMIASKLLKKHDRLKIDFCLVEGKRIVVLASVVNVTNTSDKRVKKYHLMFSKIGTHSRNNILLYVYNIFGERFELKEKKRNKQT